jgi:23S rRNA pseudouridine1911/1915/1917 synthase
MAAENAATEQKPLLEWATRLCPDSPRKRVKEWIASGRFYLDGEVVTKAGLRLEDPGDSLTMGAPDTSVFSWVRRKRIHPKLTVLYMDESLAIVNKDAGVLSVPVEGQGGESALSILGDYLNDPKGEGTRRRMFGNPERVMPLPVHRLDQYTSGLLCLAMNPDARAHLIEQLRSHTLLREYIAFCDGRARAESGTWRHFLKLDHAGYHQSLYKKPVEGSTEAVTHYKTEHIFERHRVTKVRIRLETGLKHQIRIQAAAEGLSLVGDRLYNSATKKAVERKGATLPYGFRRQALHACTIGLQHPASGKELRFESPLPGDLKRLEERLD